MKNVKVFIVDDHLAFRKGIRLLLSSIDNIKVVGEASNGTDFLHQIKAIKTDIVLMDIRMPGIDGVEATKKALQLHPNLKIIALSMYEEADYIRQMIDEGVKGYMSKNIDLAELSKSISMVMNNNTYFSPNISSIITKDFIDSTIQKKSTKAVLNIKLTKREKEVLTYICDGLTNAEIGDKMNLSHRTAQGHRNRILKKTGAKNTASLINYAYKNKLVKI